MTRTNTKTLLTSLAALGLLAAGCDIFPSQAGGTPKVVRVLAIDQLALSSPPEVGTPDAAGAFVLTGVDASNVNTAGPNGHASRFQFIDVQLNKVMDGASIQTKIDDCTPAAGGLTVAVTPAQPTAGCGDPNQSQISCFPPSWFTCYIPQTSDTTVGSQIFVFQTPDATPYDPTSGPAAQGAGLLPGYTYTVTGTVKDLQGASLTINTSVTAQTAPMVLGTVDTTNVNLAWNLTSDLDHVDLQRAPDSDGTGTAPGTFATIAAGATSPHTDGGLTAGTPYWYQLVLYPKGGGATVTSGMTNATTLPDKVAISSLGTGTAAQVAVNWTTPVAASVAAINVQRAPDAAGVAGTYKTLKSGVDPTLGTYTDKTAATGTVYWYRLVSVANVGVIHKGDGLSVTAP